MHCITKKPKKSTLFLYSTNIEACLRNSEVVMQFAGMILAKSPLKGSKQMGTASIALKLIIGSGITIFDAPTPSQSKHA